MLIIHNYSLHALYHFTCTCTFYVHVRTLVYAQVGLQDMNISISVSCEGWGYTEILGVCLEGTSRLQNMATSGPIPSETGPTLEQILSRNGFKEEDLDRECPRDIRDDIAVELGADWEMIGHSLKLSSDELLDISRENSSQKKCRVSLLDAWHKREGRGATFLKLAQAFHRQKRRDLVDLLCTKLKSTLTLVPPSGNVTSLEMPFGNDQLQVQSGSISTGNRGNF